MPRTRQQPSKPRPQPSRPKPELRHQGQSHNLQRQSQIFDAKAKPTTFKVKATTFKAKARALMPRPHLQSQGQIHWMNVTTATSILAHLLDQSVILTVLVYLIRKCSYLSLSKRNGLSLQTKSSVFSELEQRRHGISTGRQHEDERCKAG